MKRNKTAKSGIGQLGQGMTEYIIIVALIAVAGIGSYKLFGQTVRSQLAGLGDELAGRAGTGKSDAETASTTNDVNARKDKGMGSYDTDNK